MRNYIITIQSKDGTGARKKVVEAESQAQAVWKAKKEWSQQINSNAWNLVSVRAIKEYSV